MPFPFLPGEEACQAFLTRQMHGGPVSVEDVLSGRGLEALYTYLFGSRLSAPAIGMLILQHPRGKALQDLFSRFYARACRSWMLATLCRGGLWIAGGIALKNPGLILSDTFIRELFQGAKADLVRSMPVFLFRSDETGLWGAARAALHLAGQH